MSEEQLRPDPRYNDITLSKFINCIMQDGKKTRAIRVMYDALDLIDKRLEEGTTPRTSPRTRSPSSTWPSTTSSRYVEVRSKRIGGANYQVPIQVKPQAPAVAGVPLDHQGARGERGRPMAHRSPTSSIAGGQGRGQGDGTREQTHRMAEANKAFAHFAK